RMTSDAFFATNTENFDVVFIDGLHEYAQVRRDVVHALGCLAAGGWIALHDMLPRGWREQHVPRLSRSWNGDCWKIAVELSHSPDVEFRI
ncbi:class I SAM-dependent methyltransferase, partial [Mycobacterium tuberculosis]|nr:class I SAM-dependent methyltransferase [Mycobacterium tuberculosis]